MLLVSFSIGLWACLTGIAIVESTDIRLTGGKSPNQGRIEIWKDGVWGTYCGDSLDIHVAMVICRQVGFPGAAFAFQDSEEFGAGSGPVYFDGYMSCGGTERTIDDCHFKDYTVHACTHNKDAGVICIEPGYEGCFQAGSHFQDDLIPTGSGLRSVDGCLKLCRNSNISHAAIAQTTCFCIDRQPSANDSKWTDDVCDVTCAGNERQKCGSATSYSIYSSTEGFCNKLTPPENGSIDTSMIRYGTTVTFSCSPGFEITGAKKLQCLRNETHPSEFKWDGVTPTCTGATLATPRSGDNNAAGRNVNLWIGLSIVAGCIGTFSIISVIICAIRRKKKPGDTTTTTAGASFAPSPTDTMNLAEHLQQFEQRVPVSHGTPIPTSTATVRVRNESMPHVTLPPPNVRDVEEERDDEEERGNEYVIPSGPDGQSGPPARPRGRADPRKATAGTSDDRRKEQSQIDETSGTSQGDYYLVTLAKGEQPGQTGNGSRSRNAHAGPTDVDYLEILPNEGTSIVQVDDALRQIYQGEENSQRLRDQVLSSGDAPSRDTRAQDADHEYNNIINLDTHALRGEPTEMESPPIYEIYEYTDLLPITDSAVTNPKSNSSNLPQRRGLGERVIPAPPVLGHNFSPESSRLALNAGGYVNQKVISKQRSRTKRDLILE